MDASSNAVTETADRELLISRIFDAPRDLVFKAWTEPEHMVKWFGPQGFTSTVLRSELRPGGSYRVKMQEPNGSDHFLQGVYQEIVVPARLVSTFAWADAAGNQIRPETILTLTLEELGTKTKLTLHQAVFESVTACDEHRSGWTSSFERLAEYLANPR
jgi:uncharacterized protein YndB with AHSA1/START domain